MGLKGERPLVFGAEVFGVKAFAVTRNANPNDVQPKYKVL